MALNIVWTKRAAQGYDRIVAYLNENHTEKEVRRFLQETQSFLMLLQQYSKMLQETPQQKHVHREAYYTDVPD